MAPPEVWGPPIWLFFHTITAKVKDGLDINVYKRGYLSPCVYYRDILNAITTVIAI